MNDGKEFDSTDTSGSIIAECNDLSLYSRPSTSYDVESKKPKSNSYDEVVNEDEGCDDSFPFLRLPIPALRGVIRSLRHAEYQSLRTALPTYAIEGLCIEEDRRIDRLIQIFDNFRWSRSVGCKNWEHIANRIGHCMTYLEKENAMYIFGGKAVDSLGGDVEEDEEHASFNDLWKMDLGTMRCQRVFIRSPPYPLPKYNALMVSYKDELLLYGGRQPMPNLGVSRQFNPSTNEVHIFNPKLEQWRKVFTINDGPTLFAHCGVVHGDYLIVFGGLLSLYHINSTFRVLDLKSHRWFTPHLPDVPDHVQINRDTLDHIRMDFPAFDPTSCSLIVLKDGHLLLLGELRLPVYTQNWGVVVSFNPSNPEGETWQWKKVKVTGKWWEESVLHNNERSSARAKNCHYPKVVALRTPKMVRLISVGLPQKICRVTSTKLASDSEKRRRRFVSFVDTVVNQISDEMQRRDLAYRYRETEHDEAVNFNLELDGITIIINNVFIPRADIVKYKSFPFREKPKTQDNVEIEITLDYLHPSQIDADLDTGDLFEMRNALLQEIDKLHVKHYTSQISTRPSKFNRSLPRFLPRPRLISYTAAIHLPDNWKPDMLGEIHYIPGSAHLRAPPPTLKFALCAGKDEVIIHGGAAVSSHENPRGVSYTYIMSLASRAKEASGEQRLLV